MADPIIPLTVCCLVALYAAFRALLERDVPKKLLYLNVFGFAVSGSFVLLFPDILTVVAAVAFFVGTTLEANVIASAYSQKSGELQEDTP